jgi:UDP-MurNAc hydroxylase
VFLGHAGFLVESEGDVLAIDPWLDPAGAVDGAWFQLPRNHDLIGELRTRLSRARNAAIYVTHEHDDHLCRWTLAAVKDVVRTVIIPNYEIKALRRELEALGYEHIVEVDDEGTAAVGGIGIEVFIDEGGINRDSAILVRDRAGRSFLDFNDCKIYDRAEAIRDKVGRLDVFTAQFSGATMHPACYDYEPARYRTISRQKRLAKFGGVRTAIEMLQPRAFVPSAGPPAFLDPRLFHLNFEPDSVFARTWEFAAFLAKAPQPPRVEDMQPGDALHVGETIERTRGANPPVDAGNLADYLARYQREAFLSTPLAAEPPPVAAQPTLDLLIADLQAKVDAHAPFRALLPVKQQVYFSFEDAAPLVKVDFEAGTVGRAEAIGAPPFYEHRTSLSRLAKVLAGNQTWAAYTATFRFRNRRVPDVYDSVVGLMFFSDLAEFRFGLGKLAEFRKGGQRIVVETGSGERFEINRYCPHQGADLRYARLDGSVVVCPRHHWRFDLKEGGACRDNDATICAVPCL